MPLSQLVAALHLVDVGERNRRHPRTFEVPTAEELDAVGVGDLVKLIWEVGATGLSERMWVRVTVTVGSRFTGVLDNDPVALEGLLHADQVVKFTRNNICQIWVD